MTAKWRPMEFRDYFDFLRRRKWMVAFQTLFVAVVAFAPMGSWPNPSRSETSFQIDERRIPPAYTEAAVGQAGQGVCILWRTRFSVGPSSKWSGEDWVLTSARAKKASMRLRQSSRRILRLSWFPVGSEREGLDSRCTMWLPPPPLAQNVLRKTPVVFIEGDLRSLKEKCVGRVSLVGDKTEEILVALF